MNPAPAFDGLPSLRNVIEAHGLHAKKNLGQNFILDLNVTDKIASLAGPIKDRLVVEIGPGPGGLTRALLHNGARHVIAVERDDRCLPALEQVSQHWPDRLTVKAADALNVNWPSLLEAHRKNPDERALVIANLPYGIATKLLIGWLETDPWPPWFDGMALMFQREVAERIVAEPATKPYGRLSIISQWRCQCRIAMNLGPEAFSPPPKVASAVVVFKPIATPHPPCNVARLGQLSRTLFAQRRKMLRAALKPIFRNPESILDQLGVDPTLRGETLPVSKIVEMAAAMDQLGS